MPKSQKPPSYRHHKASGQALVTIQGQDIYLGPYGSAQSRELYVKLLSGTIGPESLVRRPASVKVARGAAESLTVVELLAAFWKYAELYYVKPDGSPSGELANFRKLLARLRTFAGWHRNLFRWAQPRRLNRKLEAESARWPELRA